MPPPNFLARSKFLGWLRHWSDSLHLPVLLLCAWARHLKTRTQRDQAICTSVRPTSTEDCTSGNETRTQNACSRAWSRSKSLQPVTTLVQITYHTSPNNTDHYQVNIHWIHFIENFFTVQYFLATCACPEKQSVPWIHCIEHIFFIIQDFWSTCACPENRVCPENFQARGDAAPRPHTSYAHGNTVTYLRPLHNSSAAEISE